ncbi:MAG: DUF1816 domain-containing protein [Oscillatoriophycideae cyanobacterium NC_groundwater_1537_Pr4_S-0.65um_50_18]|nr:DUF1816 domain-containing protein [Oscillatoriophycideae cyanobacterium NC_groundwater_1537_Pr4_S-0.65um_50_18]
MKELWIDILVSWGMAWWIEIVTEMPDCTYYFGPFANAEDAKASQAGYIEDLEQEGARKVKVTVKRCRPENLTVFDESQLKASQRSVSSLATGRV